MRPIDRYRAAPEVVTVFNSPGARRGSELGRLSALDRGARLIAGILLSVLLIPSTAWSATQIRLFDLDERLVDPFQAPPRTKMVVFVFVSTDCPISNRYAPEVRRVYQKFEARGVLFWLVYPNPTDSRAAIRDHMKAFAYPGRALRDPQHALVTLAKATVTPEAAVFDMEGRIVYRGRIDNRYVALGLERPAATRHDLDDALSAALAGKPVLEQTTQAVGCFLADFRQ